MKRLFVLALGDWVPFGSHKTQNFDEYRKARGISGTPLKINVFKP